MKIPQSQNIIIGAGRLDQNKNFELLIRSVSGVIHSGINCFLIILGHGNLLPKLQEIAIQEDIKDFVLFAGFPHNQYPYFRLSKIVCVSSYSEGWGMTLVEGMSLGKPFVTTPVSGASEELADNGKCGLVSDWNIEEYANCIKKLLTDQNLYEEMSKNCMEKARGFSIENATNKFDALIDKWLNIKNTNNRTDYEKKDYSKKKRVYAICCFAFAFGNIKNSLLNAAFRRLKNNCSPINVIKLFYRLMLFIAYSILFPFKFCIGFVHGCFLGSR
jgi:hypothetical protein